MIWRMNVQINIQRLRCQAMNPIEYVNNQKCIWRTIVIR